VSKVKTTREDYSHQAIKAMTLPKTCVNTRQGQHEVWLFMKWPIHN